MQPPLGGGNYPYIRLSQRLPITTSPDQNSLLCKVCYSQCGICSERKQICWLSCRMTTAQSAASHALR